MASNRWNGWKWAFIGLLLFNFFVVFRLFSLAQPQENPPASQEINLAEQDSFYQFELTVDTDEATQMVNDYLPRLMTDSDVDLEIAMDNHVEIHGTYPVLNFDLPFVLYMEPETLDDGNLVFTVENFSLAQLSIPVTILLNGMREFLDIPAWIDINSSQAQITLFFDQTTFADNIHIRMRDFDLAGESIQMNFFLENLTE